MPVVSVVPRTRGLAALVAALLAVVVAGMLALAGSADAKTVWLCKPGLKHNPCDTSGTATAIKADGTTSVERVAKPRKTPPIDCFYVYPTVSAQKTAVADLHIDAEQTAIAIQQASRFSSLCRVYAPVYRQLTLAGIGIGTAAKPTAEEAGRAPADVLAAWKDYLKHDNKGRGVVFVGHSQGAFLLKDLIAKQLDGKKLSKRLVSALLIGGNVTVRQGQDVGGQFKKIPACRRNGQIGCVVGYSSFDAEPPADAAFGRAGSGFGGDASTKLDVLCTNPASLSGGSGALKPYLFAEKFPGLLGLAINVVPDVKTPWATMPGLYRAHCENRDGASWLQVDHTAGDPRPVFSANIGAGWGLHVGDVNLAWGNLLDVVRAQSKAYLRGHR